METITILRSRRGVDEKREALNQFRRVMDLSFDHPLMREMLGGSKDMHFMFRRLPEMLMHTFESALKG